MRNLRTLTITLFALVLVASALGITALTGKSHLRNQRDHLAAQLTSARRDNSTLNRRFLAISTSLTDAQEASKQAQLDLVLYKNDHDPQLAATTQQQQDQDQFLKFLADVMTKGAAGGNSAASMSGLRFAFAQMVYQSMPPQSGETFTYQLIPDQLLGKVTWQGVTYFMRRDTWDGIPGVIVSQ